MSENYPVSFGIIVTNKDAQTSAGQSLLRKAETLSTREQDVSIPDINDLAMAGLGLHARIDALAQGQARGLAKVKLNRYLASLPSPTEGR